MFKLSAFHIKSVAILAQVWILGHIWKNGSGRPLLFQSAREASDVAGSTMGAKLGEEPIPKTAQAAICAVGLVQVQSNWSSDQYFQESSGGSLEPTRRSGGAHFPQFSDAITAARLLQCSESKYLDLLAEGNWAKHSPPPGAAIAALPKCPPPSQSKARAAARDRADVQTRSNLRQRR